MKVSLIQQIQLVGLTVAIAACSQQLPTQATLSPEAEMAKPVAALDNSTVLLSEPLAKANVPDESQAKAQANTQSALFVRDAHDASGSAKIVEADGQRYLEFDANFRSDSGPDLFVLLHREAVPTSYDAANYVNLGRLQAIDGAQRYAIPADVDIASIKSAVIWCQQFNVTFSYATF